MEFIGSLKVHKDLLKEVNNLLINNFTKGENDMSWWTEEEEDDFSLLPEGMYDAVMEDAEFEDEHINKYGKTLPPTVTITYRVTEDGKYKNRKLWQRVRLNEASKKYLSWQLGIMGIWSEAKAIMDLELMIKFCTKSMFNLVKLKQAVALQVSITDYEGKSHQNCLIDSMVEEFTDPTTKETKSYAQVPTANTSEELPF